MCVCVCVCVCVFVGLSGLMLANWEVIISPSLLDGDWQTFSSGGNESFTQQRTQNKQTHAGACPWILTQLKHKRVKEMHHGYTHTHTHTHTHSAHSLPAPYMISHAEGECFSTGLVYWGWAGSTFRWTCWQQPQGPTYTWWTNRDALQEESSSRELFTDFDFLRLAAVTLRSSHRNAVGSDLGKRSRCPVISKLLQRQTAGTGGRRDAAKYEQNFLFRSYDVKYFTQQL